MDETTKVIIATLSGFVIAFFAEPVKNYFGNRAKLHHLRVAFYTELVNNYYALTHFTMGNTETDSYVLHNATKYQMRTECYKHALQNELPLFYQLTEAKLLNHVYGLINQLINLPSDLSAIYGKRGLKSASPNFTQHGNTFKYMFTTSFACGAFDVRVLKKLVTSKQYKEIMEKGKEYIELGAKNEVQ
ncbi:MAG: hypothetical protein EHM40_08150 [Chloroflexi bacterium]|nr:MAG: hypothetical protein EHM40_08150 [Chloroflexota bacterium]